MNTQSKKPLPAWLPYVAGALLVLQFAGLSVWQVSRGFEKLEAREAWGEPATFAGYYSGNAVRPYQALKVTGHYDNERQFLLDNIILNSRYGYYAVTPLEIAANEPLVLVNRGWVEKSGLQPDLAALAKNLALPAGRVTVRGRVGSLPKPGMRLGDAIPPVAGWPKIAVYPTTADIAAALGRDVQPFVLLMDPNDEGGFVRHWVPEEMGPGKHFGYALQWFAMGAVLAALLAWHYRRRESARD